MSLACLKAGCNQVGTSFQVHETDFRADFQFPPVDALESRARENDAAFLLDPLRNCGSQAVEPRFAIVIVEGDALANLLYIRRGMKVVRVSEFPPALLR